MGALVHKRPAGKLSYSFDWAAEVGATRTLVSVTHTAQPGVTIDSQTTDIPGKASTILLSGGVHGGLYQVSAVATLSDGQLIADGFTVRVTDA